MNFLVPLGGQNKADNGLGMERVIKRPEHGLKPCAGCDSKSRTWPMKPKLPTPQSRPYFEECSKRISFFSRINRWWGAERARKEHEKDFDWATSYIHVQPQILTRSLRSQRTEEPEGQQLSILTSTLWWLESIRTPCTFEQTTVCFSALKKERERDTKWGGKLENDRRGDISQSPLHSLSHFHLGDHSMFLFSLHFTQHLVPQKTFDFPEKSDSSWLTQPGER